MAMNKIKTFTNEQVEHLLKNKNVLRFGGKYVTYASAFKIEAVKLYLTKGVSTNEIFEAAGFDEDVVGKKKRIFLMGDWVKIYRKKGFDGLKNESRGKNGGRPKTKIDSDMPDKEKIRRLELRVEYLKKENDFLAKLRA